MIYKLRQAHVRLYGNPSLVIARPLKTCGLRSHRFSPTPSGRVRIRARFLRFSSAFAYLLCGAHCRGQGGIRTRVKGICSPSPKPLGHLAASAERARTPLYYNIPWLRNQYATNKIAIEVTRKSIVITSSGMIELGLSALRRNIRNGARCECYYIFCGLSTPPGAFPQNRSPERRTCY